MQNRKQSDTHYEFVIDFNLLIPCNNHWYKSFNFINTVTLVYVIRDSLSSAYKHRNKQDCCKKYLLIYIVHLLNKYNKNRKLRICFKTLQSCVYWTVHYLDIRIKIDQLKSLALFFAQHVSNANTFIFKSLRLCVGILLWFDVCWRYGVVRLG